MANETQGEWQVTCVCGWRTRGTRAAVVAAVQEHGKATHGQDLSEEQVMQNAQRVES